MRNNTLLRLRQRHLVGDLGPPAANLFENLGRLGNRVEVPVAAHDDLIGIIGPCPWASRAIEVQTLVQDAVLNDVAQLIVALPVLIHGFLLRRHRMVVDANNARGSRPRGTTTMQQTLRRHHVDLENEPPPAPRARVFGEQVALEEKLRLVRERCLQQKQQKSNNEA